MVLEFLTATPWGWVLWDRILSHAVSSCATTVVLRGRPSERSMAPLSIVLGLMLVLGGAGLSRGATAAGELTGPPHDGFAWAGPAIHATASAPFERVGAVSLEAGEDQLVSAVIDPAGEFAYLGTTAGVVKVDVRRLERVGALAAPSARAGVMDPAGEHAYFGLPWWVPGKVVKIDLEAFQQVGELSLQPGERGFSAAVISPDGRYAYLGTSHVEPPARLVRLDLESFERSGSVVLWDRTGVDSAVIDPAGRFAYLGARGQGWLQVIKIDLESLTSVGLISLPGEKLALAAVIDPAGEFAYFGMGSGKIVKIDLDTFEPVDELDPGKGGLRSAVMDPSGRSAYFAASGHDPGQIIRIDLDSFSEVGALTLAVGERYLGAAVVDPAGEFAYFGETIANPGRLVKVRIGAPVGEDYTPLAPVRVLDTRDAVHG